MACDSTGFNRDNVRGLIPRLIGLLMTTMLGLVFLAAAASPRNATRTRHKKATAPNMTIAKMILLSIAAPLTSVYELRFTN